MRSAIRFYLLSLLALFSLSKLDSASAQDPGINRYQFYSPKPNSIGINPETVIVLRYGKPIDVNTLWDDCLQVTGEISGKHTGTFTLNKDKLTLIFKPDRCFAFNEKVRIQLRNGIKTKSGVGLPLFNYGFTIRQMSGGNFNQDFSDNVEIRQDTKLKSYSLEGLKGNAVSFSDIPVPMIYYSNGATPGNIMTVLEKPPNDYLYLFNIDGTLLLARETPHRVSNFKPEFPGVATYFDHVLKGYIVMDSLLNNVDTLFMKNGYNADAHDILLLENGHIIMESYDPQMVDMSKAVEGGDPNATVIGLVIQELDENKNLLFEWRSWDHFKITDSYNNLLSSVVDYVHCNSLDADTDSTLIFSSRDLNEITKINRLTGEIIWRLGGKNNEFIYHNDTRGFSAQHSVMKQKDGSLTLFDNGDGSDPIYSRGIEYHLDEINKEVTLTMEYRHNPDIFAYVTGNLQRLDNGNTFIFWGSIVGQSGHIITEYNPKGDLVYEVRFDLNTYPTYAAYHTKWDHNIFRLSNDSVNFGEVAQGDSVSHFVNLLNNTNRPVKVTSAYGHKRDFKVEDLPITIDPLSSKSLSVKFSPESQGTQSDIITLCQEKDSSIVARQLYVKGESVVKTGIHSESYPELEVYPNPVESILKIKSFQMIRNILICNINGRIITALNNPGSEFTIDLSSVIPGFYTLVVTYLDNTKYVKRVIKI
jgi:hypothetical protein